MSPSRFNARLGRAGALVWDHQDVKASLVDRAFVGRRKDFFALHAIVRRITEALSHPREPIKSIWTESGWPSLRGSTLNCLHKFSTCALRQETLRAICLIAQRAKKMPFRVPAISAGSRPQYAAGTISSGVANSATRSRRGRTSLSFSFSRPQPADTSTFGAPAPTASGNHHSIKISPRFLSPSSVSTAANKRFRSTNHGW